MAITLEEQIFVERGHIGAHREHGPVEGVSFSARVFWLADEPLKVGSSYTLKLATQQVEARLDRVDRLMDSATLAPLEEKRPQIGRNEVAELVFRTRRPLAFDNSDVIQETGRFIVVQDGRIGGGGVIFGAQYEPAANAVRSAHISWTDDPVSREARIDHFGHRGAVLWMTGLSGSGQVDRPSSFGRCRRGNLSGRASPRRCSTATTCVTGSAPILDSPRRIARKISAARPSRRSCSRKRVSS